MLDVHPPHSATHTWRDFLLHIATIVIGLLIAVGLEQTVEYIHHRHEISETRKALQAEFEENLLIYRYNQASTRLVRQRLTGNLTVLLYLKEHPGTPEELLPGTLNWLAQNGFPVDSAWAVAQQNSVTALRPRTEVAQLNDSYARLRDSDGMAKELWNAVTLATHFAQADPNPSHLSPAQLDKEIELTEACLEADFRWAISLRDLATQDKRFTPSPSPLADLLGWQGRPRTPTELHNLAAAQKLSDDREQPERDALVAAKQAVEANANKSNE
jgi:hypothetical protein